MLYLGKRLHRAARSGSPAESLPVLRRLLKSGVVRGHSLSSLFAQRAIIQRKHLLQLLALEAGHGDWPGFRRTLAGLPPDQLEAFDLIVREAGYPNHWFATYEEAEHFAHTRGGRCLRVGGQGVVIP
ncbi:hypothetical protein Hsar01_00601 [Haloferula sargassicola]|uniref:Uncharacterized protein n=2 Tax=Haloferula sargassicola TaxID=490096 RepID=A0ABP9UJ28_9BACT